MHIATVNSLVPGCNCSIVIIYSIDYSNDGANWSIVDASFHGNPDTVIVRVHSNMLVIEDKVEFEAICKYSPLALRIKYTSKSGGPQSLY